jgi:hypothetical protein
MSKSKYIPQNVYRALCKFALSIAEPEVLPKCTKTIEWINGKSTAQVLPHIIMHRRNTVLETSLGIYVRKNNDYSLPYISASLCVGSQTLIFIIPFTAEDKIDFISPEKCEQWMMMFTDGGKNFMTRDFSSTNEWNQAFMFFDDKNNNLLAHP